MIRTVEKNAPDLKNRSKMAILRDNLSRFFGTFNFGFKILTLLLLLVQNPTYKLLLPLLGTF